MRYLIFFLFACSALGQQQLMLNETPSGNPWLTNLMAHWKMNETSGTRADSAGTNTLYVAAAPGYAAGILGNAIDFETTSSQYAAAFDSPELSMGAEVSFTIALWVKPETVPGYQGYLDKNTDLVNAREYGVWLTDSTDQFAFYIANGSANENIIYTNVTATAGNWYLAIVWHDAVNNLIGISVNNNTAMTKTWTGGSYDSAANLNIGRSGAGYYTDGLIDSVSIWKRVLTADERTALYNSGAGLDYPFQ